MTEKNDRPPRKTWDPDNSRVYWFAQLEAAVARGDFADAESAAAKLRQLGCVVSYPVSTRSETSA